jgi:hypothetical protein
MSDMRAEGPPQRLPQPDWLHHRLTVSGALGDLRAFRTAAQGAGIIPWHLDLDGLAEDWFHRLLAPGGQPSRRLSVSGARRLAEQLRAAVARRHEIAVSGVGVSLACPFDLHALVPVPPDCLRLGPEDPAALGWLWAHWGTTQALRQVADITPDPEAAPTGPLVVTFWSADWTPWRALAAIAGRWPGLGFDTRPIYGRA